MAVLSKRRRRLLDGDLRKAPRRATGVAGSAGYSLETRDALAERRVDRATQIETIRAAAVQLHSTICG